MRRATQLGEGAVRRSPRGRIPASVTASRPQHAASSEAGDTLIEILIAVVIIALTVTALLSGLVTAITSSTTGQSLSTEDSIVNGFAQSAEYEIEQASVFTNCTTTAYRLISAPFPSAGPVGSEVTVFVTGLTANHSVTVKLLNASNVATAASVVSGGTTDGQGDASVTFTVPSVSGPQTVTVSDGTANPVSSPTPFTAGGTKPGTTPTGYKVFLNPVQQWDSQAFSQGGSPWVDATSPSCPDSGAQLVSVFARGPDGSLGSLSFVTLGQATTTILMGATSSSSTPTLGDTLTFKATVVPPNSTTAAPTGSIEWAFSQSPGSPACPDSTLAPITGTNTSAATCTVPNAQVGLYTVTASYPAQGTATNNYGPGSGTGTITVGKASSSATVTEASSPSPAQPDSKLTFTATVGANPAVGSDPKPSGPVVWSVTQPGGGTATCQNGSGQNLPSNTYIMPSGGTGTNAATCVIPSAAVGSYTATAIYGGDGNYNAAPAASSAPVNVSKATPTISFSTQPTSPQVGSNFTIKATVNEPNGGPNPTGQLAWTVTTPSGTTYTCTPNPANLDSTGSATCLVSGAAKGTYNVAASYGGDPVYNQATGSTQVVVALAPAGFDIQAPGNQDGKPDTTDTIVYTYNQAMSLTSILPGWNGSSTPVVAEFNRTSGQTQLTIQCSGFRCNDPNLGTVNLGDATGTHYLNGGGFGGTTVDLNAAMAASTNAAGQTVITITLSQSNNQFNAVSATTTLTWSPSASATSTGGVACATTSVTESGAPKKNF